MRLPREVAGPDGEAGGTGAIWVVTNGGHNVTSGAFTVRRLLIVTAPVGVAVQVSVNAMSRVSDGAAFGRVVVPRVAWWTELSSGIAIIALLPAIWLVVGRLMPRSVGWPRSIAGHILASVGFSLLHIVLMTLVRLLVLGSAYASMPTVSVILYEYRKDAWSYALLACILASARWIGASGEEHSGPTIERGGDERVLVVQDGPRRHVVLVDGIDYVEAAGNYVEIVTGGDRLLYRSTLTKVAVELGDRFVRIHRSRLVNAARVRLIESNPSGDFDVETTGGGRVRGSRRYRAALEMHV